jgi:cyclopropane fatty-acyl-phospholipid synthase-like methyltransferase
MSEYILVYLEPVILQHPWWQALAELLLSHLDQSGVPAGATVLDAGCGWSVTLQALEHRGYRTIGLDISRLPTV